MIIIPTLHTKQLRINIEDQRLVIYDDENPPTVMYNVGDAEYPKLFISDPDETDPENRISMVPSLLRIVQYGTNEQKVFISSAYRVVLNSVEEEDRIVAVLNSEFNRKRQADMNETYGKVSHYTHTWEQDDYASFHFVEREGQDGSRTLFVIGIGTHIDEEKRRIMNSRMDTGRPLFGMCSVRTPLNRCVSKRRIIGCVPSSLQRLNVHIRRRSRTRTRTRSADILESSHISCIISPEAGNHYFYHYIHTRYLKISLESNASTFVRVFARLEVRYYSCFVLLCFSFLFVTLFFYPHCEQSHANPTTQTRLRATNNATLWDCDCMWQCVAIRKWKKSRGMKTRLIDDQQ